MKPGAGQLSHHPGHRAVIGLLVGPHEDTLVHPAAGVRDRLQLRHQIGHRDFGVVDENPSLDVDRKLQRRLVLLEALGLGLRQIERHAHGQKRRRHHEDDQQHQHDVHHRRDVDLRHHGPTPAAASAAAGRACHVHRHDLVLTDAFP